MRFYSTGDSNTLKGPKLLLRSWLEWTNTHGMELTQYRDRGGQGGRVGVSSWPLRHSMGRWGAFFQPAHLGLVALSIRLFESQTSDGRLDTRRCALQIKSNQSCFCAGHAGTSPSSSCTRVGAQGSWSWVSAVVRSYHVLSCCRVSRGSCGRVIRV
jgi:hypothetical protein